MAEITPAFHTAEQICKLNQISMSFLLRALRAGRCRGVRVGRQWRIRPEWASQFMESLAPEHVEHEQLRMVKR